MNVSEAARSARSAGLFAAILLVAGAFADTADVRLRNGLALRGEVVLELSEVVVHTPAGDARYPRRAVEHIDWLRPADTPAGRFMRRLAAIRPDDLPAHVALARWAADNGLPGRAHDVCDYVLKLDPANAAARALLDALATAPATQPAPAATRPVLPPPRPERGMPPPPPLSKRDILRLKLSELELDGPAERVNVRLRRERGQPDLPTLVRRELARQPDRDPRWDQALRYGKPYEQLQVVVRVTGLKYLDRIEVRGNPQRFVTFRRRVLPLIVNGCARSGCHGGANARAFRFPVGSPSSDAFVYTSFALLDRMTTPIGPMFDRDRPEQSALVQYLMPSEKGHEVHPPVPKRRILPVLKGTRDPRYQALIAWIGSLHSPHPDYRLEYQWPAWMKRFSPPTVEEPAPAPVQPAGKAANPPPAP